MSVAAATAALVAIPAGGAGSATSCVAWASLPRHITLSGAREVHVHATLHATPECRAATFDNGGTAVLNGPGGATSNFPLRWSHIGATDIEIFSWGVDAPGVYRIGNGDLQTYDANSMRIPFTWRTTSMRVRDAG